MYIVNISYTFIYCVIGPWPPTTKSFHGPYGRWGCKLGIIVVLKEISQHCIGSVFVQHAVETSSNVTVQGAVSQHHSSVMKTMIVKTGRMKTAVSNISIMACIIISAK